MDRWGAGTTFIKWLKLALPIATYRDIICLRMERSMKHTASSMSYSGQLSSANAFRSNFQFASKTSDRLTN